MSAKVYCEECGKEILAGETYYYSPDTGNAYCEECGDRVMTVFQDVDSDGNTQYIHEAQDNGGEYFLDDEYSDLEFFILKEMK